jgi:hypothetical protein
MEVAFIAYKKIQRMLSFKQRCEIAKVRCESAILISRSRIILWQPRIVFSRSRIVLLRSRIAVSRFRGLAVLRARPRKREITMRERETKPAIFSYLSCSVAFIVSFPAIQRKKYIHGS